MSDNQQLARIESKLEKLTEVSLNQARNETQIVNLLKMRERDDRRIEKLEDTLNGQDGLWARIHRIHGAYLALATVISITMPFVVKYVFS